MNIIKDTKQIHLTPSGGSKQNSFFNSSIDYSIIGLIKDDKNIIYNTISIIHAEIPYSFYIINEYNNVLNLSTGKIIVDFGNYNVNSLMKYINSKLPVNMILSFNSTNGKFILTYNQPFNILPSSIYKLMGLEKNKTYNSINYVVNFPYPANLLGTKNLYIKSNIILSNYNSATKDYVTLGCIPVNVEPYSIILYNNFSNSSFIINNISLNNIEIEIYDDDNNLVDFNNIDWSIIIEINSFVLQEYNPTTLNNVLNNKIEYNNNNINST